jgi:trigger factor
MKVQVEDLSAIKKKLIVEVEPEKVRQEWETVFKKVNKTVKLKGFRPGKVPRSLVEKYYGPQIDDEVVRHLINETYPEALKETKMIPVAFPEFGPPDFDRQGPFTFQATVELKPEVAISDYRGLSLTRVDATVAEELVDKRLDMIREAHGELVTVSEERPVREGDYAVIDYRSWMDDRPVEGGSAEHFDLEVGAGRFNPEFEKELVGLRKGEEKEFEIPFPEGYSNAALSGKTVKYRVVLQDIKEKNLPELNDEFAKGLQGGGFTSLEELKKKIREDLERMERQRADQKTNDELLDQLAAKTDFELPEGLVQAEIDGTISRLEQDMTRRGVSWPANEADRNRVRENIRPAAEKRVRGDLILEKIAEVENITVTPEEIEAELGKIAAGVNQSVGLVREVYNKNNLMSGLQAQMLQEKTLNFLKDQAQIA